MQWNYEEFVAIKCKGNKQNEVIYKLEQQSIQCHISQKKDYVLLKFDRNYTIRLSTLIQLHQNNIVIVSPNMILNIIKLCYLKLKMLQEKQWIDGSVIMSDIWFNFGPQKDIYITLFRIEEPTISNKQIQDLIIQLWVEFSPTQQKQQRAFVTFEKQLRSGTDLSFLPYTIEVLEEVVQQQASNFAILEKTSSQFKLFIRFIPQIQFTFIQTDTNATLQFYSMVLNELIINQGEFIATFNFSNLTATNFRDLLVTKLELKEILIYFQEKSANILLEEQFLNLDQLRSHCLQSSLFNPFEQRLDLINTIGDPAIVLEIIKDLRSEWSINQQNQAALEQQYQGQIKAKILEKLSTKYMTEELKVEILNKILTFEEIIKLNRQFTQQSQSKNPENSLQIIEQYITQNNHIIEQAIKKSKEQVVQQILSKLIHE